MKRKEAPYKALDVAHWFINQVDRECGDSITHLKVQKLLYFAQAYYLANFSKPLINEDFEAWVHGPVIRAVYDAFSGNGSSSLDSVKTDFNPSASVENYLVSFYDKYGALSAKKLEALSHKHQPWIDAREGYQPYDRCEVIITKEAIKTFYASKISTQ
jgi:uncharacterized phage-associated protein